MRPKSFLICFLFVNSVLSQIAQHGIVVDSNSLEPIPYVNISWSNSKGTITNEQGNFKYFSEGDDDSYSIYISHLGYENKIIPRTVFPDSIYLVRKTYQLNEVTVIDTKDLKNKILKNMDNNYDSEKTCESFFIKQFLQENGDYVNYLEALGVIENRSKPDILKVNIKGVRKTDDLITSYINFIHQNVYLLLTEATTEIINKGEIIGYDWVDSNIIEATLEEYKTKQKYLLTIDTSDHSIQKVVKNTLTNELKHKFQWETIRDEGEEIEFEGFLQGKLLEYDFKKVEGKYYLNRIRHKVKAVLVSKDNSIKHEFISEQLYLTTQVISDCQTKEMKALKRGKALNDLKIKDYNKESWQVLNAILPLVEQQKILNVLGKAN
jgi:hypothetical protein